MSNASLAGSLASFKLPDVFTFLATSRKTGMLTLATRDANAEKEAYVFFRAGGIVYAASNQESLRLGSVLLRKKKITREQSASVDESIVRGGKRFGEIAVDKGILTPELLGEFLKVQVAEVIYDAFVWREGTFAFYDDFDLPSHAVTITVDLANLIMEGARRIAEWEHCLALLPDSDVVFRVVSDPQTEKITLSLEEWKILFLINGQRTLEDLCREVDDEALHVYRVVYGLFANKLIEPVDGSGDTTTRPVTAIADDATMRHQGAVNFGGDSTVIEMTDDTNLLVSSEARLSYGDVVRKTVAQLTIGSGEDAGKVYPLTEGEHRIGRLYDNDILLNDLGVSGHHARIYRGPDGYAIEDLKSRNGTWVNNTRVYHSQLAHGDQLRLGATDMTFEILFEG
jgi:Domain of unknown function (DUF4388)/Inner membrane component of T3SS, cytoplasmic domain